MRVDTVKAAVAQCERAGLPITVSNVAANVELKPGDYNAMILSGLRAQVAPALKRAGYITKDEVTNEKVPLADASLTDLKALLRIKRRNKARIRVQYDALKMLVEFLDAKQGELGYEPYVHLFEDDARRIYAMHGLDLPKDWGKA